MQDVCTNRREMMGGRESTSDVVIEPVLNRVDQITTAFGLVPLSLRGNKACRVSIVHHRAHGCTAAELSTTSEAAATGIEMESAADFAKTLSVSFFDLAILHSPECDVVRARQAVVRLLGPSILRRSPPASNIGGRFQIEPYDLQIHPLRLFDRAGGAGDGSMRDSEPFS
jgi:hypothetical protein